MIFCWLGFHRWTKWLDGACYAAQSRTLGTVEWHDTRRFMTQTRRCDDCGKKQSRHVDI